TPDDIEKTYQHLQRIEDVRPLFASLQWALFTAARMPGASNLAPEKRAAIARTAKSVARALVEGFRALPFYEAWDAKHRHSFFSDLFHHDLVHNPAEQLHLVLRALDVFSPDTVDKVGNLFGKVLDDSDEEDPCRTGAGKEALDGVGGDGSRVVVYGHTHDPAYAPLAAGDATEDVYLNSGTFRKRIFRTDDGNGFVRSEHLTYLCFMSKAEAAAMDEPTYAAWMGVRGAR